MSGQTSYWSQKRLSRRTAVRAAAIAGSGAAALSLIGCGGSDDKSSSSSGPATEVIDSTKGTRGGHLLFRNGGAAGSLVFVNTSTAGFTHSGLLEFRYGRPVYDPFDIGSDPDLAEALPEQPDGITYRFKLRNAKFQNGREVTSEDVRYSFTQYATNPRVPTRSDWFWFDKIETPDAKTVIVKTKEPFAEAIAAMTAKEDAFILAKEHEESPEGPTRLMGSGPFIVVETQPPFTTKLRRNPDYFMQPYPYFDEMTSITSTDTVKRLADFISRQTHQEYWFAEEERDQIKKARPDAVAHGYETPGFSWLPRSDQAPFNDKRVRQALSMSVDRKQIRDAVSKGEGEEDQSLSAAGSGGKVFGFQRPSQLGNSYRYWKFDPTAAKQLLSAAGITQPIETTMSHWDTSVQQPIVDSATLMIATWRQLGIANVRSIPQNFGVYSQTSAVGNYDGLTFRAAQTTVGAKIGVALKSELYSPPEGSSPPTKNVGRINDPELNVLADKQLGQLKLEDRKQTFRLMETNVNENQYRSALSTYSRTYFTDPSVKNAIAAIAGVGGARTYMKYWWFG